ncbi:OmpA/MotB domain-containing protein [Yersinia intermedia]|uniref:OmpA family protein n=1 Tax=Yersinia intermedia TaxID=631 RepID=UPI0005E1FB2D|nr:OmpA family protein [Yersinia intermedia]MDA5511334.1 OmpA family protein [Yersinia intermedia]CNH31975.1 OmpA/MotB domain-containing protein [Yersinia intermedia]CNH62798.1 OmpA/MotB domain-containing protein [Yersinia intermedia]CQD74868.1 OmpA/MotB domain-containing protein [Yersinia intermedia]
MRGLTQLLLLLLGACLALWLILGFWPLGMGSRVALSMLVVILCAAVGYFQWRKYNGNKVAHQSIADSTLPPEDFQGAVVLVCGDSDALFSSSASFRETRQGWYLAVKLPEQLPILAQHLAAERPALIAQISVLLAIVPEQHQNLDDFSQFLRAWQRAIVQCKGWLGGIPPVWLGTWLSPPVASSAQAERWYTVTPGQKGIQVQEAGAGIMPLVQWSQYQESCNVQERLSSVLWMESLLSWLDEHVLSILTQRQGDVPALTPCTWGCCFTPVAGRQNNLWQAHISEVTTLTPRVATPEDNLPLPEVLLPYLPRRRGVSRLMLTCQMAGVLCGVFLLFALLASFINNQRLVQSVSDHLSLYNRLTGTPPAPKALAQQQLRADAHLLDDWLRRGAPMRLSLGLYQGLRLRAPLDIAINSWTPPLPPPPVINQIVQGSQTLRLDSLSLFDVGQSMLKSGSTKVLINALVGIKAKPGWLIVVAGHTDITGDDKSNQALSLKRAESVRNWMRDTGDIPESCFAVQGYGQSRPLKSNDTEAGRALNRRVEISLVPQADACRLPGVKTASQDESDVSTQEMEK